MDNGKAEFWQAKAEFTRRKLIEYLWRPEKHACYDRDRNYVFMEVLVHNNLCCMWHGIFTQDMADAFIRHHLLNPEEFWTPMPLVSIVANNPKFQSSDERIIATDDDGVTFKYTDSKTQQPGICQLPAGEFMRRYLQHGLPPGLHRVRYFGWMHPGAKARQCIVETLLAAAPAVPVLRCIHAGQNRHDQTGHAAAGLPSGDRTASGTMRMKSDIYSQSASADPSRTYLYTSGMRSLGVTAENSATAHRNRRRSTHPERLGASPNAAFDYLRREPRPKPPAG